MVLFGVWKAIEGRFWLNLFWDKNHLGSAKTQKSKYSLKAWRQKH